MIPLDLVNRAKLAAAHSVPSDFVHHWLFSSDPYAFRGAEGAYSEFRGEISTLLDVHAAEITLVGSAQLGFSLRPNQLFRAFRDESDLDVVVASSELFDGAWRDLLEQSTTLRQLEADDRK